MLLVPQTDKTLSARNIPTATQSIEDIFAALLSIKRANCPDWTDESSTDFGIQLLWLYAVLGRFMVDQMERIKRGLFIGTVTDRATMQRLLELIDYSLSETGSASVSVTFTLESGHPGVTIPGATKVGTAASTDQSAIIFETSDDELVGAGVTSVIVGCVQGVTVAEEILGSSDGTTGQQFTTAKRPAIALSETVEVNEGVWAEWTRVDNFVSSGQADKHYRVVNESLGYMTIQFGDGVNGVIPVRGANNIRITYRVGSGAEGNVGAGTITELVSSVDYVLSVTNATAASGGTDRESLDHARIYGPAGLKALDRAVTVADIESLIDSYVSAKYGGVAVSKAFEVGGQTVHVMVVPRYGGNPSDGMKSELQTMIESKRVICTNIAVIDPTYHLVDITADVYVHQNHAPSVVGAAVKQNLLNYLSPTYQNPTTGLYPHGFGRNIYLSDIYATIDGTAGVDYCDITEPADNEIVPIYKIADIGDITLTIIGPAGEQSFVDLRTDRSRT